MLAAKNGHAEAVKVLLAAGANANMRDISGKTALMFAESIKNPSKQARCSEIMNLLK
jgi:ankyrin repeat protein